MTSAVNLVVVTVVATLGQLSPLLVLGQNTNASQSVQPNLLSPLAIVPLVTTHCTVSGLTFPLW